LAPTWGSAATIWVVAAGRDDDDGITSFGANYATNFGYGRSATGFGTCELATSWRTATAASEDPPSTGLIDEAWIAYTVAVRPVGGGGTTHTKSGFAREGA
jgi:hypothetical protein